MTTNHVDGLPFDLNLLRVLNVLLQTRGVTRAAQELGLTQSGVSRSLKRLRTHFGDPLLVRDGRHMVPTAVAQALRLPVARILEDTQLLFVSGRGFDPREAQWTVRIASAGYTEHVFLPHLLSRLYGTAPGVNVSMVLIPDAADALLEGRVDFVVEPDLDGPDLVRAPLFGDGMCCVVRAGHPVVERGLCLEQFLLLDHVLVAPQGTPGGIVDETLRLKGLRRRVRAQVSSFTAPMSIIADSDCIVTMPRRIATQLDAVWDVAILEPPLAIGGFSLSLFWSAHRRTEPAHRWFRGIIRDAAAMMSA